MAKRVTIEALAEWLRDKDDIALLGHISPDGDAAGSNLAMYHALRAMGKRAVVCLPEGIPLPAPPKPPSARQRPLMKP